MPACSLLCEWVWLLQAASLTMGQADQDLGANEEIFTWRLDYIRYSKQFYLCCLNAVSSSLERFLAKIGWGADQHSGFGESPGVKSQILNLVRSIRTVMRFPLIGVNIATIILKLLFG
ncbi:Immediate early response 3-interacting protein 1 [Bulinus truncatus]|nr:Immediate early response 3-interacting protein 1 [Bulinus truncatus]